MKRLMVKSNLKLINPLFDGDNVSHDHFPFQPSYRGFFCEDIMQTSHSKRLDRFEEIQLSKAEREVAKDMLKALRMVRKGKR